LKERPGQAGPFLFHCAVRQFQIVLCEIITPIWETSSERDPELPCWFHGRRGSFKANTNLEDHMLKKLLIGTALSAFAISNAFAQANPSTDPPANSQQQMQSGTGGGSQMKPSNAATTTTPAARAPSTMGASPSGNKPGTTDDSLKAGTEDKPASSGR
jgi:hypothetical protein